MSDVRIPDSAFRPAVGARLQAEPELPPAGGFLRDSWRRLRKNKAAVIALALLFLIGALALLAPVLSPYDPNEQHLQYKNLPPKIPGVSINGLNGMRSFRGQWVDA